MKPSQLKKKVSERKHRDLLYSKSDYWDTKAREYAGTSVSMWPNNHLNFYYQREQIRVIEGLLPDVKDLTMLDLGCGTGRMSRYFAGRGARVTGIDFSNETLDLARSVESAKNPTYRYLSMFDLYEHEIYDLVFSFAALTVACRNEEQLSLVLERVYQSLKPGGGIMLVEPVHRGFLHRVLNLSPADFKECITRSGFIMKRFVHLHFWPVRLKLCYISFPRWLTAAGYYSGLGIMKLFRNRHFGDYQVYFAEKNQ